jgi:plastocyanin
MKQSIVASVLAVLATAAGILVALGPPAGAQGGGTIVGEVKLAGPAPAPKTVKVNKDNQVCGEEKKVTEVAVGPNGGVAYTIVSVPGTKAAKTAVVLDQKGCEFRPHVVTMPPGELKILNSDGVLHNIHTFSTANPPVNKAQPKFRKEMVERFEKPELIKVQCDAHSWMLGWIYVTENAVTVTDANGAFKLENVPAGKHKVEVTHPVLGKQTKEVEVKAGQEAKVAFELKK